MAAVFAPNAHVGAEDLPAYDPRVENALSMLDLSPATNQLRSVLDSNHVDVHFVPMPPGLYARYSVGRHVIEIDDRWIDADEVTLAAVIAHEATHAEDAVSGYLRVLEGSPLRPMYGRELDQSLKRGEIREYLRQRPTFHLLDALCRFALWHEAYRERLRPLDLSEPASL